MDRLTEYLAYHEESMRCGDVDPSYAMLRYVCERFELNLEQRYWLAFVYALTYCGATVYYVYNEFPDYENVDSGRLARWWNVARARVLCQTDRRWTVSGNQFVPAVESYRDWVGLRSQAEHFARLTARLATPEERYEVLYKAAGAALYSFGRFTLFLYLEALHVITDQQLMPTDMDLDDAHASRNGLCYAYGLDQWLTPSEAPMPQGGAAEIGRAWDDLRGRLSGSSTVWNIETTLCAYKKYRRTRGRYVGYYLDRQAVEIAKMARGVPDGVAWSVLWDYRRETYGGAYLIERVAMPEVLARGIPTRWRASALQRTDGQVGQGQVLADAQLALWVEGGDEEALGVGRR